jgi:acyl carrier protein
MEHIDTEDIDTKVKRIIAEELQVEESAITDEATIAELGGDSLKALALVSAFEAEFNITIPDEDLMAMNSIQAAVDIVKRQLK